jgi:hypothetical protein
MRNLSEATTAISFQASTANRVLRNIFSDWQKMRDVLLAASRLKMTRSGPLASINYSIVILIARIVGQAMCPWLVGLD